MPVYKKIDDSTLLVRQPLADSDNDWGAPRLTRLFNFKARQITTIYERGGTQSYKIPRGDYSSETGQTAAVTAAIQIQNFRDLESTDEVRDMHAQLVRIGGRPPNIDDVLPGQLNKKLKA